MSKREILQDSGVKDFCIPGVCMWFYHEPLVISQKVPIKVVEKSFLHDIL